MNYNTHSSLNTIKNRYAYWTERQAIAYTYLLVATTDIISTYFGIEKYGLHETISWTTWIIEHLGWEGTILRLVLFSFFIFTLFRYLPKQMFNYIRIPAWIIAGIYFVFTTANNTLLILNKV
jgi:hypothetical protein